MFILKTASCVYPLDTIQVEFNTLYIEIEQQTNDVDFYI